jgi:hypothetical protein
VLLLLAIAGANASTLLAGLADARRAEMGMRQALGTSRGRIVRQVLAEAALLAVAGAVVSEAFAATFFGTAPAVGRHVLVGGEDLEVVGVVEDAPVLSLHEAAEPFLYIAYARRPSSDVALLIDTAGEPATLAPAARALVRETSPGTKVIAMTTPGHGPMTSSASSCATA